MRIVMRISIGCALALLLVVGFGLAARPTFAAQDTSTETIARLEEYLAALRGVIARLEAHPAPPGETYELEIRNLRDQIAALEAQIALSRGFGAQAGDSARPADEPSQLPTLQRAPFAPSRPLGLWGAAMLLVLQYVLGWRILSFLDPSKFLSLAERLVGAVVLGLTASASLVLLLLLILRSWPAVLVLFWGILFTIAGLAIGARIREAPFIPGDFFRATAWRRLGGAIRAKLGVLVRSLARPIVWGALLLLIPYILVILGVLILDPDGFPQGVLKGWGDVALHLGMIERLKTADPFILESHIAAGEPLAYPFLVNLLSALYQRIGAPTVLAWHLPVLLGGGAFFFLIFALGRRLLQSGWLAVILVAVVFFGGGLGFLWFFKDVGVAWQSGGLPAAWVMLADPPHEYTHLDLRSGGKPAGFESPANIAWIVPAISFLSHQRSFPLGLAIGTLLLIGLAAYRGSGNLWRWGLVGGFLPLAHTHTFLALALILPLWFWTDRINWRAWLGAVAFGGLLAAPALAYLLPTAGGGSAFRPWLGWMACTHQASWYRCDPDVPGIDRNLLWFWAKNFGVVFAAWVLALAAAFRLRAAIGNLAGPLIGSSLILFLVPNLVRLQPWEFDNNKVLFWWWVLALLLILLTGRALARRLALSRRAAISLLVLFTILTTFAGFIDVAARLGRGREQHFGYYGEPELRAAEWIRAHTRPNDRFLTGDSANHFVPLLTGRPLYLGFPGWLWSQGRGDVVERRRGRASAFLASGDREAICGDGVGYVVWDQDLTRTYPEADRGRVLDAAEVLFHQDGRDVVKLTCSER